MLTILKIEKQQLCQPHPPNVSLAYPNTKLVNESYLYISNWQNQVDEEGPQYIGANWGFYLGKNRKAKENWNCFSFQDILKYCNFNDKNHQRLGHNF